MKMENTRRFVPNFSNIAFTENGAVSYASTGKAISDQFGKAANYRGRDIDAVFTEQAALWAENNLQALRFPFYLRLVTRKVKVNNDNVTEKVQKGQGVRDESFKRLLWLAINQPDAFYKNIWVLPLVGSWKDIWTLLHYDIELKTNAINHSIIFDLINEGLKCKTHSELIKKFMPRIKTHSKCHTDRANILNELAREYANYNKLSYKEYNKLKTSGTAHDFQKLICSGRYADINWNLIPGRALNMLASEKFLQKHDLEKGYTDWVMAQPTVKYTGYVYELGSEVIKSTYPSYWGRKTNDMPIYKKLTYDKQFEELVKKAIEDGNILGNVWCALDTSGSMTSRVVGDISAFDICVSLGVFFSTINTGAFHKNVIMFDNKSTVMQLKGGFCDMIRQIVTSNTAWGGTNFQSVIDEIVSIRKQNPDIPLEDYPQTLLIVSDMQFNPVDGNRETNYEAMKRKLYEVFPKDFVDSMKFIWWQVTGRTSDVPATLENNGCYFLSGFDGSVVTLLLGGELAEIEKTEKRTPTMEELIGVALGQEILSYVNV
jgi:hypothetical protein